MIENVAKSCSRKEITMKKGTHTWTWEVQSMWSFDDDWRGEERREEENFLSNINTVLDSILSDNISLSLKRSARQPPLYLSATLFGVLLFGNWSWGSFRYIRSETKYFPSCPSQKLFTFFTWILLCIWRVKVKRQIQRILNFTFQMDDC
jgi:hypothetical protein